MALPVIEKMPSAVTRARRDLRERRVLVVVNFMVVI